MSIYYVLMDLCYQFGYNDLYPNILMFIPLHVCMDGILFCLTKLRIMGDNWMYLQLYWRPKVMHESCTLGEARGCIGCFGT